MSKEYTYEFYADDKNCNTAYLQEIVFEHPLSNEELKSEEIKKLVIDAINESEGTSFDPTTTTVTCMQGKHLCKYCSRIVDGEFEDLLCDNCRSLFGHSLFSEL